MSDFKNANLSNLQNKNTWNYFDKRLRSVTELKRILPFKAVSVEEINAALDQPSKTDKRSIYIHIQFCAYY